MLFQYFDLRGSGADRERYIQRGSNEEGNGTIIQWELAVLLYILPLIWVVK